VKSKKIEDKWGVSVQEARTYLKKLKEGVGVRRDFFEPEK